MSLLLLLLSSQYINRNLYTLYRLLLLNINFLKRFYEFYNRSHIYIYNSKYFVQSKNLFLYIFIDYILFNF